MVLITPLRMVPIQRYRHFLYVINEKQPTFKYAIEGWLSFFLLKSLYYQRLFVSLQHENPPSLSTMLKCAGRFCIYTFNLKIR